MRFFTSRLDPRATVIFKRAAPDYHPINFQLFITGSAASIGLVVGALIANAMASLNSMTPAYIMCLFHPFIWLLYAGIALAITVYASALPTATTDREALQLLALSNMSGRAMFQGYFLAALYRIRAPILFGACLIPMFVVMPLGNVVGWLINTYDPPYTDLLVAIFPVLTPVRLWGTILFAAAVGTDTGMHYASRGEALIYTLLQIAGYFLVNSILLIAFGSGLLNFFNDEVLYIVAFVAVMLLLTAAPYALTARAFYRERPLRRGVIGSLRA